MNSAETAPSLCLNITYDQMQNAVECTTTYINKDKIKIHAEIRF